MQFDSEKHFLLWDMAHRRCIHQEAEFQSFLGKVREAGYEPFEVEVPDWPPALRTPLPIIVMRLNLDGGDSDWQPQGGPTAQTAYAWHGTHLALEKDWHTERKVRKITKEMVPAWDSPLHRVAYAWGVPEYDPREHRVIRYWCRDNNVNIVDFWSNFFPTVEEKLDIVETANPTIYEEQAEGSYSPTRRCVRRSQLYLLRNHFLGANEEPPAPDPESQKEEIIAPQPQPQPRFIHDDPKAEVDAPVEWKPFEKTTAYPTHEAIAALEVALGRDVRPFSGTGLDSHVVAISEEDMTRFLTENPVDKRHYIRDDGGRNFDCDDFALTLRAALIRDCGYNCCAVIAGDVHAWCAFILTGLNGPKIAFVEPQTDGLVTDFSGQYAVDRRCEVII